MLAVGHVLELELEDDVVVVSDVLDALGVMALGDVDTDEVAEVDVDTLEEGVLDNEVVVDEARSAGAVLDDKFEVDCFSVEEYCDEVLGVVT